MPAPTSVWYGWAITQPCSAQNASSRRIMSWNVSGGGHGRSVDRALRPGLATLRRMRIRSSAVGVAALLLTLPGVAGAAPSFKLRRVAALNGAGQTVFLGAPKGDSRRVRGRPGAASSACCSGGTLKTFIDLRSRVESGGERGLLSIAFHPKFASNHRFFVYYNAKNTRRRDDRRGPRERRQGHVPPTSGRRSATARRRTTTAASCSSGRTAGCGSAPATAAAANDQFGHAQDRHSLLGKMLRLNVDARGAKPRIWGIGLRNPWRFSFDRAGTDTLWIGDVGQSAWEEIDRVTKPSRRSLRNFGWSRFEGRQVFNASRTLTGGTLVMPLTVRAASRSRSRSSAATCTAAPTCPALRGYYLYSDNGGPWIRGIRSCATASRRCSSRRRRACRRGVTSFGEDGTGNVYVCTYGGIYRIVR